MGASETPERRSNPANGMVPAVGRRLRNLLAEVPTPFPCRYACFIHPRRRPGEQGFGVITAAGESLPLTVTLLTTLERVPTLFEGRARVLVGPATGADSLILADGGDWSVPLPVASLSLRLGDDDGLGDPAVAPIQTLTPSHQGPHLTLLCATRPEGWPP